MEHNSNVHPVVETPSYLAPARKLFSELEIVAMVAADPKCGDPMRETGGFRKVRVRVGNRGKSGWSMADGHLGYAVPIGGVVAYRDAISPSGVGFEIGCGNKAVRLDMPVEDLRAKIGTPSWTMCGRR